MYLFVNVSVTLVVSQKEPHMSCSHWLSLSQVICLLSSVTCLSVQCFSFLLLVLSLECLQILSCFESCEGVTLYHVPSLFSLCLSRSVFVSGEEDVSSSDSLCSQKEERISLSYLLSIGDNSIYDSQAASITSCLWCSVVSVLHSKYNAFLSWSSFFSDKRCQQKKLSSRMSMLVQNQVRKGIRIPGREVFFTVKLTSEKVAFPGNVE